MRVIFLLIVGLIEFSGTARADCPIVPTGSRATGVVIYNANYDVFQVCKADGTWQAISPINCPAGDCGGCPSSGLVAHWRFDESSGTTATDSAYGNDGTFINGPVWNPSGGRIAGALLFDSTSGTDDAVEVQPSASLDDLVAVTISAWIRPTGWGAGDFGRIFDKNNATDDGGYELYIGSSTSRRLFFRSNRPSDGVWHTPNNSIALNTWQHIVLTYAGGSTADDPELIINGIPQSVTEQATPAGAPTSDAGETLYLGNRTLLNREFHGLLDEVRVYNRVLSPAELSHLYNAGAGCS